MYAIEIETDVRENYIRIPEYQKFKGKHIKVIFMSVDNKIKEPNNSKMNKLFNKMAEKGGINIDNPVAWQNDIRKDKELY